ncbi:hypothetical protein Tco_1240453, partial [Tanacetum coccineum]
LCVASRQQQHVLVSPDFVCSAFGSALVHLIMLCSLVHIRICVILCSASVCICLNLHLFGLLRNETPSNAESALWDAQ